MPPASIPTVLSIAGSDSGAGAGIQADLKTFAALGVYGTTAITAVTAQNSQGVTAVHALPPEMVAAQIDAVLGDIGADAIKIGMLANADIMHAVAGCLDRYRIGGVVLDPVMVAASGDRLVDENAIDIMAEVLMPRCSLITPNIYEAQLLSRQAIENFDDVKAAAQAIRKRGARAVLITGGHGAGNEVRDFYFDGEESVTIVNKRLPVSGHGTGCTLSSAVAAYLARGLDMSAALKEASAYVHHALEASFAVGGGQARVLAHFNGYSKG